MTKNLVNYNKNNLKTDLNQMNDNLNEKSIKNALMLGNHKRPIPV